MRLWTLANIIGLIVGGVFSENWNSFDISDAEIIRDDRLEEHAIFVDPIPRDEYAPMYDFRFFAREERNFKHQEAPKLKIAQRSANVAYNHAVDCRQGLSSLESGALVCFATAPLRAGFLEFLGPEGDKFCHSHGYDQMVDMLNNVDLVKVVDLHKELLNADPLLATEVTLNALRTGEDEIRWCDGVCIQKDLTDPSNVVSFGALARAFPAGFDTEKTILSLVAIDNSLGSPKLVLAQNITPACIIYPGFSNDPLMQKYPLTFNYRGNETTLSINDNTALPNNDMIRENFVLDGNHYDPQFAPLTQHEVVIPRLRPFKRAKLVFHHLCGTSNATADPMANCQLSVAMKGPEFDSEFTTVDNLTDVLNDGSVLGGVPWKKNIVSIPRLHQDDHTIRITGVYDWKHGGLGLDNIHLNTMQRCHPRWIKVQETGFKTSTINSFQEGLDNYELGGLKEADLRTKHKREVVKRNDTSLEECSRLCWSGSGCDMFEFDSETNACTFHPHTGLKKELWANFVTFNRKRSLYVLECSESQENILIENDFEHDRSSIWTMDNQCGPLFLTRSAKSDKMGVFGGNLGLISTTCGASQHLEIKAPLQNVVELPMRMDQTYLDVVKPAALAIVYVQAGKESEAELKVGSDSKLETLGINETKPIGVFMEDFNTHYSSNDEIIFKETAGAGGSDLFMSKMDILIDLPIRIGCFHDPQSVIDPAGASSNPDQTPAKCLVTCIQANHRLAMLRNGDECICIDDILSDLGPARDQNCSVPCAGDPHDFCGGPTTLSVFVATCPVGMTRFGDYCYIPSDAATNSMAKNERLCTEIDESAHLWYPESEAELLFVQERFPAAQYHIGYRQSHPEFGFQHSDYSFGVGLSFYTTNSDGSPKLGVEKDLFGAKCLTWTAGNTSGFHLNTPCEAAQGICRRKLVHGYGYKRIGANLKYQVFSSLLAENPTPIPGTGPFQFELAEDYYSKNRFLEISLPEPIVISGLIVEADQAKFLKSFSLEYVEMATLFPERFRNLEIAQDQPVIFQVFEEAPSDEQAVITRKILLPFPIETKHFRILVQEGNPMGAAFRFDLIGQSVLERYSLNPVLERTQFHFDIPNFILSTKSSFDVTPFEISPGGSATFRILLPTKQKTPENKLDLVLVSRFFIVDAKGKTMKFSFRLPQADPQLNILIENGIGLVFSEELRGPFPMNPTYNSPVEVRVEFLANGFKVFVNGLKIKLFKDIVVNNVVPKLTSLTWGTEAFNAQITRVTLECDNRMGFVTNYGRTLFTGQRSEETKVNLAPIANDVILKEEGSILQMFYRSTSFKPGEYDFGHIPFQFIQQCYHSYKGNAKCFTAKGMFNTEKPVQYGYGGGLLASQILPCPTGYEYFGEVCVHFPVRNPESYTAALSKCLPKGDIVYFSPNKIQNVLFRQAMEFLYKNQMSHTMWIGVRKISGKWMASNGRALTEEFSDWAPNEPKDGNGNCVIADKALKYKWRTVNCAEPHASICALGVPNCPLGYIYETKLSDAPQYESRSCFKIAKLGSFIDVTRSKRVSSVSVADAICRRDNTRLFAPRNAFQANMIHDWLSRHSIWDKTTNQTQKISFYTGVRSFSNQSLVAANDFEPSESLNVSSVGSSCFKIDFEWGYNMSEVRCDQEFDLPIDETNREFYGICQYKECRTTLNTKCKFPFRYKGRLYDTCIDLEPEGKPWCSTGVDADLNHIPGYEKECNALCHVNNCPIGFYRNYMDRTCYQVSSKHPRDGALSFEDAEMQCKDQGSRLWEPRTVSAFHNVLSTDMSTGHFSWMTATATATGLKTMKAGGELKVVYRSSDLPVSEYLLREMIWEAGFPVLSPECVGLVEGKLRNVDCDGYQNDFSNTKHLGYICESRPIETVPQKKTCIFPFVYQGKSFLSCALTPNPNVPSDQPWCATKVDPVTKEMIQTGQCQDERLLMYDGGAQGLPCSLPFFMDGQFFESCTRQMLNGTNRIKLDKHWCPPKSAVDPVSRVWLGSLDQEHTYGYCTEFMKPLAVDCGDEYENVGGICMRLSAVPATYNKAVQICKDEGGNLAYIPSQSIKDAVSERIVEKKAQFNHFKPVNQFWLGAYPTETTDAWNWNAYAKPMSLYQNWKANTPGFGCPSGGCKAADVSLAMRAQGIYEWEAANKSVARPYICASPCPGGYDWIQSIGKCIMVVEPGVGETNARTLPQAMKQCQERNGRLLATDTCDDLEVVREELIKREFSIGDEFFVGTFAFNLPTGNERLRSTAADPQINSYGYAVDMSADAGSGLCSAMDASLSAPDTSVTNFFAIRLETALVTLHYPATPEVIASTKKGYLCESDALWGCPDGYIKLTETCVKLVRSRKQQIDADQFCKKSGDQLARPSTLMDIYLLHSHIEETEGTFGAQSNERTARYFLDFSRHADPGHRSFEVSHQNIGCACNTEILIPGTTEGSDGNCYMRDMQVKTFADAGHNCNNLGMKLAEYSTAGEYNALLDVFGLNDDLWIGAHNPDASTCPDAAACANTFKWASNDSNVDCTPAVNSGGCQSSNGHACLVMAQTDSGNLVDESCGNRKESMCQKVCNTGQNDKLPRDCVSMQMSIRGNYPALTRVFCYEAAFFACEHEQSLAPDLRPILSPPVAVLALSKDIGTADIKSNLVVEAQNIGFDSSRKPNFLMGSALFGGNSFQHSNIDLALLKHLHGDQVTVAMWLRTQESTFGSEPQTLLDFRGKLDPTVHDCQFELLAGVPQLSLPDVNGAKTTIVSNFGLAPRTWHFLAFSFSPSDGTGFILVDTRFTKINATQHKVFDKAPEYNVFIGGSRFGAPAQNFQGALSCVQIFDQALNPSQMHYIKNCSQVAGPYQVTEDLCSSGWSHFKGRCYRTSTEKMAYSDAQAFCLALSSPHHRSHLMWNANKLHFDFVSRMINRTFNTHKFWIGLDEWDQDGVWSIRDGIASVSSTYEYWEEPSPSSGDPNQRCALSSRRNGGFMLPNDCEANYPFACERTTLDSPRDHECPKGYLPIEQMCLLLNATRLDYVGAQETCARSGGVLFAPKSRSELKIMRAFAKNLVKGDTWIGITTEHMERTRDDSETIPLVEQLSANVMWSDGNIYDPSSDFDFDLDVGTGWQGPCLYLKSSSDFTTREVSCSKPYNLICRYSDPTCPPGYSKAHGIVDGRSCLKMIGDDTANIEEMCSSSDDFLRRPAFPTTRQSAEMFQELMSSDSIWLGIGQRNLSSWNVQYKAHGFHDPRPPTSNESLVDLRRIGSWLEDVKESDESSGCLSFTNNGLIKPEFNAACDEARPAACEYRACLTKRGQQCIFPFNYFNRSEDGTTTTPITYHHCASLDIFTPWCPTALSPNGDILAWDECLDDCPQEPPEVVCELDPPMPKMVDGSTLEKNFTVANYQFGEGMATSELDFVEYSCPEGYFFNGTNQLTVRAFCKNWDWELDFDPETSCIPVKCKCPQWFPPNTRLGTYDWNNGFPPPRGCNETEPSIDHLKTVTYQCPDGFFFNTQNSDIPMPQSSALTFTCSKFADWLPAFQPHCIPKNCLTDPPIVENSARDRMHWDLNLRNKSFSLTINYTCPLEGWGYPTTGENLTVALCQENLQWNITKVDKCAALPCPRKPPATPKGGHRWYNMTQTKYRCPEGHAFQGGSNSFLVNCTGGKEWNPRLRLPQCVPRACPKDPPLYFLGQDQDWPFQSRKMGTKVTYTCPFLKATEPKELRVQYSECIYDKDTGQLFWYPQQIKDCSRKFRSSPIIVLPNHVLTQFHGLTDLELNPALFRWNLS